MSKLVIKTVVWWIRRNLVITVCDLGIEDGGIEESEDAVSPAGADDFDATGLIVAPGFIDMHVHLREPGFEHAETIETGSRAAAAGGFTSICCMPNTDPVNDKPTVTSYIIERAHRFATVNVFPIGAITKNSAGEELSAIGFMKVPVSWLSRTTEAGDERPSGSKSHGNSRTLWIFR